MLDVKGDKWVVKSSMTEEVAFVQGQFTKLQSQVDYKNNNRPPEDFWLRKSFPVIILEDDELAYSTSFLFFIIFGMILEDDELA